MICIEHTIRKYINILLLILVSSYQQYAGGATFAYGNPQDTSALKQLGKGRPASADTSGIKGKPLITGKDKGKGKDAEGENILERLYNTDKRKNYTAWYLDPKTFDLVETISVDTLLFFPNLDIPIQKRLETYTTLGNVGSPMQSDHFFNRNNDYPFLFSRYYIDYTTGVASHKQFNVRRPLTQLIYSTAGKKREAEQILRVLHTQNVNKFLNFGLQYDYFNTKGIYDDQLTRDNFFAGFMSYNKNRLSAQGTFAYNYVRNQENGGVVNDYYVQDTVMEASLIEFNLQNANSEYRQRSFSGIVAYDLINRMVRSTDSTGKTTQYRKPILTLKAMLDAHRHTRTYSDQESDSSYYSNFYISPSKTHDSVRLVTYESTLLAEISQIARYPGLPGLRAWVSYLSGSYYYFKPGDFIYPRTDDRISTSHFGVGVYSYSPYLSYTGSLRMYLSGYRSADKELTGQLLISPWMSKELPYVKGKILISDKEPDLFAKNYFSNHFKWDNSFEKEKWFMLGGSIGAEKWRFEAGYNLVRINEYVYFDTTAKPAQASGVTITSAYLQKVLKLGSLHFTNRIVWQANTNSDVLSLPALSLFSSLYFEYELVKNVLWGQLGVSGFYRTKFYADAYMPATGQFYNQRVKKIGDYPMADAFINLKWKRALIFFKFDHVNMGIPNNEYFTALHYPANRRVFKFGVSWIFYN